jgi:hypothetical protein
MYAPASATARPLSTDQLDVDPRTIVDMALNGTARRPLTISAVERQRC